MAASEVLATQRFTLLQPAAVDIVIGFKLWFYTKTQTCPVEFIHVQTDHVPKHFFARRQWDTQACSRNVENVPVAPCTNLTNPVTCEGFGQGLSLLPMHGEEAGAGPPNIESRTESHGRRANLRICEKVFLVLWDLQDRSTGRRGSINVAV